VTRYVFRRDGDSWTVVLGPEMEVGGFQSEQAAGRWLIEWLTACMAMSNETAMKSRFLAAALLEPRLVQ
jgi:hypothetical protein